MIPLFTLYQIWKFGVICRIYYIFQPLDLFQFIVQIFLILIAADVCMPMEMGEYNSTVVREPWSEEIHGQVNITDGVVCRAL